MLFFNGVQSREVVFRLEQFKIMLRVFVNDAEHLQVQLLWDLFFSLEFQEKILLIGELGVLLVMLFKLREHGGVDQRMDCDSGPHEDDGPEVLPEGARHYVSVPSGRESSVDKVETHPVPVVNTLVPEVRPNYPALGVRGVRHEVPDAREYMGDQDHQDVERDNRYKEVFALIKSVEQLRYHALSMIDSFEGPKNADHSKQLKESRQFRQ